MNNESTDQPWLSVHLLFKGENVGISYDKTHLCSTGSNLSKHKSIKIKTDDKRTIIIICI